uniref:NR LBD domain-containing protein n=1 Tax=Caenorhabditis tropicalis TaxID=1561998 RepID=A0A1I7T6J7_9PELO
MESQRNYQLFNSYLSGNPSISELAKNIRHWKLEPRNENVEMSIMEWGYHSGVVSIDFMSKFPFIDNLDLEDKIIVFRQCYFYSSLLFDSLRASKKKQDFVCFPDGTEVIELDIPGVTKHFENDIRSRLAGRANELRITREEVLLLSVILMCNPALPDLSPNAQTSLTMQQRIYSSALVQHCLQRHQKSGPSRFADLLSLFHVIVKTRQDISHHFVISSFQDSRTPLKRIFWDY